MRRVFMGKVGAPTKYKKEYCEAAILLLSKGYSKEALAGKLSVNQDTIYEWIKVHKAFSEAIKIGESKSLLFWEGMGIGGSMGKIAGFNANSWYRNMQNRHGWRDKREVEGNNDVENLIKALASLSGNLPV